MHSLYALILLLDALGVSASPAIAGRSCNADNCLRAIEAAAFVTRQGTIDCSSYFRTTITPATVTVTHTASQTTSTATSLTNTVILTSTQTNVLTLSTPVTTTSIETDSITLTVTVPEPVTTLVTFDKRQATGVPSSIPAYASPCSGSVRYSSACSCVGATKSTVIAVAPSTTIIVTQSFTQTSTYQTTTSTTTITTDLTTTTVAVTNTLDLTTTLTAFATTTLTPVIPTCSNSAFQIQALSGAPAGRYAELYNIPGLGGDYYTLNFVGVAGASTFAIDPVTGYISTAPYYNGVVEIGAPTSPFLFVEFTADDTTDSEVSCAIGVGNTFTCVGTQGQTMFQTCPALGSDYASDVVLAATLGDGCTALVLQAVCPTTTVITSTAAP